MKSLSPTLELMKADARPGCCIACGSPIPPRTGGGARVLCGDPECLRTWKQVWTADRVDRVTALRAARHGLASAPHRMIAAWGRQLLGGVS